MIASRCPLLLLALFALGGLHPVGAEQASPAQPVWALPDPAAAIVGKARTSSDPDPERYPTFSAHGSAFHFDGKDSYLRLPDSGDDPRFRFTKGDTISVEAWVRCDGLADGQFQYLIGKGRTSRPGFPPDNQNWALRLRGANRQAKLSFLFRSEGEDGDYHRWTSSRGFAPGRRWHHVALTYTFGEPESLQGWIDGRRSEGSWDKSGATVRAPVVDDDEVWIGSSQGGSPGNTFHGALAGLALYRSALSEEELRDRYRVQGGLPPVDPAKLPAAAVRLELYESDSGRNEWPIDPGPPLRSMDTTALALFRLPTRYDPHGQRRAWSGPKVVRLATMLTLPPGEHELLLRAPGLASLSIDGAPVASLAPVRIVRDAHGHPREPLTRPYPLPRIGTQETRLVYRASGQPQLVVIDAVVGDKGGKVRVGELLLAARATDQDAWNLLSPARSLPFTAVALEHYRERERQHFDQSDGAHRRRLAEQGTPHWRDRHRAAAAFISSLPAVLPEGIPPEHAIDHFLAARIDSARGTTGGDPEFAHTVHPLFEEHCVRCHGKKAKGGLRLTSREAALEGGDSGPALVPGHPAESELLIRLRSTDEDLRMPPKGDGLNQQEIAAVSAWIARGASWPATASPVRVPDRLDDHAFLRRLFLDTVGVFPEPAEVQAFIKSTDPDRSRKLIDRLLADPRRADHWVSYWQDVLAENPRLVKPTLNNTGPFRWWLHEALLDHKPLDRMVTELITARSPDYGGGAGDFRIATENDSPLAAKAHILGTAFLGLEMKCARCHDAPYHERTQQELFSLAAMLHGKPLTVPATSSVPREFFEALGERKPLIEVTLDPGTSVPPSWPFDFLVAPTADDPSFDTPAAELAYQITRAENRRFAQVIVNRVWKRYFGQGFVEPADDWEGSDPSHPELLDFLARDFVTHGYDLRHLSRRILNSEAYRRAPRTTPVASPENRFFEAPLRRRLTAEQLVDSLFAATDTPLFTEELTLDVEGWYPDKTFLNMGRPRRAWEFVSLSTERDRPSLTLPLAQSIVTFMEACGWRPNRTEPLTERRVDPDVLQAGLLANGLLGTWWTRASDYSTLTALAVGASSVDELIEALYLRLLTRLPGDSERAALRAHLGDGFDSRLARSPHEFERKTHVPVVREVSWRNHLSPEANLIAAEREKHAQQGPPPTDFLSPGWRERFEDAVWALINSPELQYTP